MPMIARHDFNSAWWGEDTGIVRDPGLFELGAAARQAELEPWPWVEYRERDVSYPRIRQLAACGFMHADVQIAFRVRLAGLGDSPSTTVLEASTAADIPFRVQAGEVQPFLHERFFALPGATPKRVATRYTLWCDQLIQDHPRTCVRVALDGTTQGWFLAQAPSGAGGLDLTLAMLHRDATISGSLLYRKALAHFGAMGHRVGQASFGATNTAVLNVYSSLGARYTGTVHNFLWVR